MLPCHDPTQHGQWLPDGDPFSRPHRPAYITLIITSLPSGLDGYDWCVAPHSDGRSGERAEEREREHLLPPGHLPCQCARAGTGGFNFKSVLRKSGPTERGPPARSLAGCLWHPRLFTRLVFPSSGHNLFTRDIIVKWAWESWLSANDGAYSDENIYVSTAPWVPVSVKIIMR